MTDLTPEEEKELVEEMASSYWVNPSKEQLETAEIMLSVVRKHPEVVARVCPECKGNKYISDTRGGEHIMLNEPCLRCHGTGVVSREA